MLRNVKIIHQQKYAPEMTLRREVAMYHAEDCDILPYYGTYLLIPVEVFNDFKPNIEELFEDCFYDDRVRQTMYLLENKTDHYGHDITDQYVCINVNITGDHACIKPSSIWIVERETTEMHIQIASTKPASELHIYKSLNWNSYIYYLNSQISYAKEYKTVADYISLFI